MRESFPYESNVLLLSQILVPYPIGKKTWKQLVGTWEKEGKPVSLLAWTLRHHHDKASVLRGLEMATGAEWKALGKGTEDPPTTRESALLERHGFLTIGREKGKWLVGGGPDLPPNLESYLGPAASRYKWVLMHPSAPISEDTGNVGEPSARFEKNPRIVEKTIHEILESALLERASDLFFESDDHSLQVRYRQGSRIHRIGRWENPGGKEILRLLKRWANFTTATASLPQDGRIETVVAGESCSFRASHVCAENGESLVLRRVGSRHQLPSLSELGIGEDLAWQIRDGLLNDPGLVLCTGSTCSGKTTTACAILNEIADSELKIISIEDPVEHEIPGILHSNIDPHSEWNFSSALSAYLRQDPDVIMVGELRDGESASMACRAAITGHGVITTLHARNPEDAIQRIMGWNIESGLLKDCLRLVIHQHLEMDIAGERLTASFSWKPYPQIPGPALPARQP